MYKFIMNININLESNLVQSEIIVIFDEFLLFPEKAENSNSY